MNTVITANELKTQGVSAVESHLKQDSEVIISVRGKERYVVIPIDTYAKFREYELTLALQEAKDNIAAGQYHTETIADHIQRITHDL